MKKPKNYNLRIFELDQKNLSPSEIIKTIYKEYSIRLTKASLKQKLIPHKRKDINRFIANKEKEIQDRIIEILKENKYSPLNAREISFIFYNKYNNRISKHEINKLIFSKLKEKVEYCRDTFTYRLIDQKRFHYPEPNITEFERKIHNYSNDTVIQVVSTFFKNKLITVSTGHSKIDYLIKTIVKDNRITEAEEIFLKNKAIEFGLKEDIIDKAKLHLEHNNPYLDEIIHVIFDDGIISDEELHFLNEKTIEHNFKNEFVNNRFWLIGVAEYKSHLLKLKGFENIFKLIFIYIELGLSNNLNDRLLINQLNIFSHSTINEVVLNAENRLKNMLNKLITETSITAESKSFINQAYEKINLDNYDKSPKRVVNENFDFKDKLITILKEEKKRIGDPAADLLAENILFRLNN